MCRGFSQGQDLLFSDAFNCFLESLGWTAVSDWGRWIWENSIDCLKIESIFQLKSLWLDYCLDSCDSKTRGGMWGEGRPWWHTTYIPASWQRWCTASRRLCWGPRYQSQQKWAQWSKSTEPYSSETETATVSNNIWLILMKFSKDA